MKKLLLLLLVVCMTFSVIACAGRGSGSGENTKAPSGGTSGSDETDDGWADSLPADLNFDAAEIRIVYPEVRVEDIFVEEAGGDVVDSAVQRAQITVEDRLNVTYNVTALPSERDAYSQAILQTYLTNQDIYDIVGDMIAYAAGIVTSGPYADLKSIPYLDFSKPYWNQSMVKGFDVDGHLYFCSGDAGVSFLRYITCMMCDYKVAANNQIDIEELQQLVIDGKWTAERMKEYATGIFNGADPTNVNRETDTVGLMVPERDHATPLAAGMGLYMFAQNSDGELEVTYGNAHAVDVIQWLVHLFNDNVDFVGTFTVATTDSLTVDRGLIAQERALFATLMLNETSTYYEEIAADYTVLPMPKWSEEDEYSTFSRAIHITNAIMRTCSETELAGAVLECMASVGYTQVTPAFFEESMKVKYSDAIPASRQIFDIIRDSVTFDWGFYCMFGFANSSQLYVYTPINDNNLGWASLVKARESNWSRSLDMYLDKLKNLESDVG